jgi:hypothetical protein
VHATHCDSQYDVHPPHPRSDIDVKKDFNVPRQRVVNVRTNLGLRIFTVEYYILFKKTSTLLRKGIVNLGHSFRLFAILYCKREKKNLSALRCIGYTQQIYAVCQKWVKDINALEERYRS